jgi:hypothetical protein
MKAKHLPAKAGTAHRSLEVQLKQLLRGFDEVVTIGPARLPTVDDQYVIIRTYTTYSAYEDPILQD